VVIFVPHPTGGTMDPRSRLERKFPGERLAKPFRSVESLALRDREEDPPRPVLGEGVAPRSLTTRPFTNTPKAAPNAPQLMRLMRHPFRLHTAQATAVHVWDVFPWKGEAAREPTRAAMEFAREALGETRTPNPVKESARLVPRGPVPSVDEWLGSFPKRGGEP
jgi:hypothetical protein